MRSPRDVNGRELKEGDSIEIKDYVPQFEEYIIGTGRVRYNQEEDQFYLESRPLFIYDHFTIIN